MLSIRHILLISFTVCLFSNVNSQTPANRQSEESILKIYEAQLKAGYQVRSMSDVEIKKYIAKGGDGISSVNDFAVETGRLFRAYTNNVAILFFFFNNDTLYRFFMEPGKILERAVIPITEIQLQQLDIDVYATMDIYDKASTRAPRLRGLKPVNERKTPGISFQQSIANATKIFLPTSFDERFQQLIVIPAFGIGSFPFQLLKPYGDSSYLIDKCSFSVVPSLMDFIAIRKRMLKENPAIMEEALTFTFNKPMFVCNPDFPVKTDFIFPPLPGAKKEIGSAINYSSEYILFEGNNATKKNVMDSIRYCDVAYFATHGIASDINPLDNNFLVLSGENDPFLTSRNILSLRDSNFTGQRKFPELVILSACQTGLGKSMQAGIFGGLARCFLIAGSNQVIMSLWNVDDEATAYLMSRFVYYLSKATAFLPAEPLRLAELDTKIKYPNPSQWASFSVYGVSY